MKGILVADDSPTIRRMLVAKIKQNFPNLPVLEAENGKEALHVLTQNNVSGIITDLDMGDFGGEDFVDKIKSNSILKKKYVIVFSSRDYTPKQDGVYFCNKNEGIDRLMFLLNQLQ
jgi:CheY-like chemotaxis protein